MSSILPGYVVCPYNKSHVILKHKIQGHLVKCAKQHPNSNLVDCPFDITHKIRPEDKDAHIEKCPSREGFDRFMYSIATNSSTPQQPMAQPFQSQSQSNSNDGEESWDDCDVPTYDPQQHAQNAQILRIPTALSPSERRQFADSERKRLSKLEKR